MESDLQSLTNEIVSPISEITKVDKGNHKRWPGNRVANSFRVGIRRAMGTIVENMSIYQRRKGRLRYRPAEYLFEKVEG